MKEKDSGFPWYMIYTPILFVIFALWYWDWQTGDNTMAIFKEIINWLDINDRWVTVIGLLAAAIVVVQQTISKMRSSNKDIRSIKQVADTAPKDIKNHIDAANAEISKSMVENKVVLAQIETRTEGIAQHLTAVMANRPEAPVQQGQLIAEISGLYALHDADQRTIASLREQIAGLEREKEALERQNTTLQQKLDSLEPKPRFDHRLR